MKKNYLNYLRKATILVSILTTVATFFVFCVVYSVVHFWLPHLYPKGVPFGFTYLDPYSIGISAIIGVAVAVIVGTYVSSHVIDPLQRVEKAAQMVAQGDFSARVVFDQDVPKESLSLITNFNAMAEQLEVAKKRIITWNAQIAHELRTPITILLGKLYGLADGVFVADDLFVSQLLKQITVLCRLVDDLRTVSLADGGQLELRLSTVSLADEIRSLVNFIKPEFYESGFRFNLDLMVGEVSIDVTRMRQAILALLENARIHADPGELYIKLSYSLNNAVISITDTGPGLEESFSAHVFEEFSRSESTKNSNKSGSGLGLSVVKAIVKAHGGHIIYCPVGGGSSFIITLPR